MSSSGRVEKSAWRHRATAEGGKAAVHKSARPVPVAVSLRASLNGLGSRSGGTRVIDRDLESLASRDSLGSLSRHHGAHLATKFGRYPPVDKRLLNRCGKLALPTKLGCFPVTAGTFGVVRLNSPDGFTRPMRRRFIMTNMKSRPLLCSRFPVPRCCRVAYSVQPLCSSGNPSLPDELG